MFNDDIDRTDIATFLKKVAITITSKIGGTSGPIWGTAFLRFAATVGDKSEVDGATLVAGLRAAAAGIQARGKAELGDKTMLATITLATQHGWLGTWIGSTIGMVAADALAILVGRWLGRRLPEKIIAYGAAALFAIFGIWLIVEAIIELR